MFKERVPWLLPHGLLLCRLSPLEDHDILNFCPAWVTLGRQLFLGIITFPVHWVLFRVFTDNLWFKSSHAESHTDHGYMVNAWANTSAWFQRAAWIGTTLRTCRRSWWKNQRCAQLNLANDVWEIRWKDSPKLWIHWSNWNARRHTAWAYQVLCWRRNQMQNEEGRHWFKMKKRLSILKERGCRLWNWPKLLDAAFETAKIW